MEDKDKFAVGFMFFVNSNYVKRMNHCWVELKYKDETFAKTYNEYELLHIYKNHLINNG